jgi:hypothetical protein
VSGQNLEFRSQESEFPHQLIAGRSSAALQECDRPSKSIGLMNHRRGVSPQQGAAPVLVTCHSSLVTFSSTNHE